MTCRSNRLTSNSTSNSYFSSSWMYQHFPVHRVPVSLGVNWNQSLSFSLFCFTYWKKCQHQEPASGHKFQLTVINDSNSSFSLDGHCSLSRGPALTFKSGIDPSVFLVWASTMSQIWPNDWDNGMFLLTRLPKQIEIIGPSPLKGLVRKKSGGLVLHHPSCRVSHHPSFQVSHHPSCRVSHHPSFQVSHHPSCRVSRCPFHPSIHKLMKSLLDQTKWQPILKGSGGEGRGE